MEIRPMNISCGIKELHSLGYEPTQLDFDRWIETAKPIKHDYKTGVRTAPGGPNSCAMIVASLTSKQTKAIDLLEKNGFKRVGDFRRNPNSGNDIGLWVACLDENGKIEIAAPVLPAPVAIPPAPLPGPYVAFKTEQRTVVRDRLGRFAKLSNIQAMAA